MTYVVYVLIHAQITGSSRCEGAASRTATDTLGSSLSLDAKTHPAVCHEGNIKTQLHSVQRKGVYTTAYDSYEHNEYEEQRSSNSPIITKSNSLLAISSICASFFSIFAVNNLVELLR